MKKNYTTGSIVQSLVSLAVPIVITNLLHSAYQLTDTFWVGRLGADAVAAVSLSFPIIFLLMTLGGGFSIAGTILVAQYKGKGDEHQVNHVATQTMVMVLLVSVMISVLGYTLSPFIISLMGAEDVVYTQAVEYLRISSFGMVFMFGFFMYQSLMRGVGEVNTPLYIVATTVLMNLVLDPFFIMGWGPIPGSGVTGAAYATISTQGVAMAIGTWLLMRGRNGIRISFAHFGFDRSLIKQMFFLGLPASIEMSMKALGLTIVSFIVASFGTSIVAAYGIGIRVLSFIIIPAFGLSMATSTLVGQNMGAGKPERARETGWKSAQVGFVTLVLVGVLTYMFARPITAAFIPGDDVVIDLASVFVRSLSFAFGFLGIQFIFSGVFQGAGNTRISMIFSIISLWVLEFPLTYILSKHTSLAEFGIWVAPPIAAVIMAGVSLTYFFIGKWDTIRLIKSEDDKLQDAVLKETMIEEGAVQG